MYITSLYIYYYSLIVMLIYAVLEIGVYVCECAGFCIHLFSLADILIFIGSVVVVVCLCMCWCYSIKYAKFDFKKDIVASACFLTFWSCCSEFSQDISVLAVSVTESNREEVIQGADEDDEANISLEVTYSETSEGQSYHCIRFCMVTR